MSNESNASVTWKNWSENIVHKGKDYYYTPKNSAELKSVLHEAKNNNVTLRVSGQRHSQPPLVADDHRGAPPPTAKAYVVDMSCYVDLGGNGIELGPGPNQVTVNPGVREDDLDAFLTKNNLMLKTVTAGGFFSIGGITVVDVNGATVEAPIFAEMASVFTILGADGKETTINSESKDADGHLLLPFARVSLGALGIVTRITIDVLPRPWATTLQGDMKRYLLKDEQAFVAKYKELLTTHTRVESFYTPYAATWGIKNFLALWWDVVEDPNPKTPNSAPDPETACALSKEDKFGAPYVGGIGKALAPFIRKSQEFFSPYDPFHIPPIPTAAIAAIALDEIEDQVEKANENHSALWLTEAARVIFMSYFIELPDLDDAGLGRVWESLEVVADYVTKDGNFHIALPMEFRFIKGGDSALAGTFTTKPDSHFVNLDLAGFVEPTSGADYPDKLLKFFALVERKWVAMGGLPHNGKMYGFYDPKNSDTDSYTPPFNKNFLSFITEQRIKKGAPVEAFKKYRATCDPNGRFYNEYLRDLLGG